jgi:hypothetical protein
MPHPEEKPQSPKTAPTPPAAHNPSEKAAAEKGEKKEKEKVPVPEAIEEQLKQLDTAKTAFDESVSEYKGDATQANATEVAVAAQSYASAIALLADELDQATSLREEAKHIVSRCRKAVTKAQEAIAQANPVQVPALQNAADVAISRLQEAQERLNKIDTASAYPVTGR